jgi:toxin ParE1/3/4
MIVEFSNRAVADLRRASAYSRAQFGPRVAAELEQRIRDAVDHIARNPEGAPQVGARPGVRVLPLTRYPYRIFYRILQDRTLIVHIRHTSRQRWAESS